MPYVAHITRVADGETRTRIFDDDWDDEGSEFWWSQGNYSCDCNRYLEFERAGGHEPDIDDGACGEGAYRVKIVLPDGSVPYWEGPEDVERGGEGEGV